MKVCIKCHKKKPLDAFYKKIKTRDGKNSSCIKCCLAYAAAQYRRCPVKNIERIKKWQSEHIGYGKQQKKKAMLNLYDSYIKKTIVRDTQLQFKDIPLTMVEKKREQLRCIRLLKKIKNI